MSQTCIVCHGGKHRVAFQEFDVAVLRCATCGHVFSSHEAPQDFDGYFGDDTLAPADQFWWNDAHDRMYDAFCGRYLEGRRGRLVDVGCGLGYFVRRASTVPGWDVSGYETSRSAVEYARKSLQLSNVFPGTLERAGLPPRSVDVITLWDVIEHIPDPDPLLACASSLLTERGMLFIHTPNAVVQVPKAKLKRLLFGMRPGVHYLEAKDHVNIYAMRTLRTVLARNGLGDVRFVHLPPIQSVSGSRSVIPRLVKRAWCQSAALLHGASGGTINLDNLFAVARRSGAVSA